MIYSEELKALVCTGYAGRSHKAIPLTHAIVKNKDNTTTGYLSCSKCHVSYDNVDTILASLENFLKSKESEKELEQVSPETVAENVSETLLKGGEDEKSKA